MSPRFAFSTGLQIRFRCDEYALRLMLPALPAGLLACRVDTAQVERRVGV